MIFKTRGHYCNYMRKVMDSKTTNYTQHLFNILIWNVYDNNPEKIIDLRSSILKACFNQSMSNNNKILRDIFYSYGYTVENWNYYGGHRGIETQQQYKLIAKRR